ncbi:hypothetical protein Tco_0222189 [Tanacetum coccineum]
MCAEVLSAMIRSAVLTRHIHGVKVSRGASEVSHLFFTDDSIFFTRASVDKCTRLHNILGMYCRSSGQVINFEKSETFFSPNVESRMRRDIISKLDVREAPQQTAYLRLPSIIGRKKKCVFQAIIHKVRKKIAGWKERNLSIGGKEVMLKSVAQAMPMYVMNIFLLLDESINEIHRAFNCYWWGNGNKDNLIRWASWESMCISKSKGGMGYYPRNSLLDARIVYRPSFVWRSLCSARDIIRRGKRWNVRNGMWNFSLLLNLFPQPIATKIACTHINTLEHDSLYWNASSNGMFTCKVKIFAWRVCMNLLPTIFNLMAKGLTARSLNYVHLSPFLEHWYRY